MPHRNKQKRKEWYEKNKKRINIERRQKHKKFPKQQKDWHLRGDFGINLDRYNEMLKEQNETCAICLKSETFMRKGKISALSVDHDHKTGKVRGLLCMSCNHGLGRFKDDIILMERAIKYLKK